MKKSHFLILLLPLLISCLATNSSYSPTGYDSTFEETREFSSHLDVSGTAEPVHFRAIINLESGSCYLVITKPNGDIAREYHLDSPGQKNLIADFNAVKGRWKMQLTSENARGSYKIHWDIKKEES